MSLSIAKAFMMSTFRFRSLAVKPRELPILKFTKLPIGLAYVGVKTRRVSKYNVCSQGCGSRNYEDFNYED